MPTCPHCGKDIELASAKEAVTLIPARQEGGKHLSLNTLADWRAAPPAERRAFVEYWTGVAQKNGFTMQTADALAVCLQRLETEARLAQAPLIKIAALCVTENE